MGETLCVVGLGYIGLPTAAMFATHGHRVVGVDVDPEVLQRTRNGRIAAHEPDLQALVNEAVRSGNLRISEAPDAADAFILCVPTPQTVKHEADLRSVDAATRSILPHLQPGNLIVLESTVPPGTVAKQIVPLLAASGLEVERDLLVAHCPERVMPGFILRELVYNDRIIGGLTPEATRRATELYRTFVKGEIYPTDATTAEFVKLIENTYRDVNIALSNELAKIAERVGVNVWDAIHLANRHPRVHLHLPGPGVGGHCIAVDPWFIVSAAPQDARLIRLAREVNDAMPGYVVETLRHLLGTLRGKRIALLGIAYKGNIDDARESPALVVLKELQDHGAKCRVHDPRASVHGVPAHTLEEAVEQAHAIVLLTDHREFKELDPLRLAPLVKGRLVFDTRNALPPGPWKAAGFTLVRLGEPPGRGSSGPAAPP